MTRRRVSLTASLLAAVALAASLAVAAPARAASACESSGKFCVSSIAYGPATVNAAQATPVVITVKANSGLSKLQALMPSAVVGSSVGGPITLNPVSGSAGTYRGSFTVSAGSPAGSYTPIWLRSVSLFGQTRDIADTELNAAGLATLTITGTADVTAPNLVSFSTSGNGSYDASRGGSIAVTVRATDASSGVTGVTVIGSVQADDPQAGTLVGRTNSFVYLARASGTAQDGVWTGSLSLVGGTNQAWNYTVDVTDAQSNHTYADSSDLAARGLPSTFRTVTTGVVPAAPTGLKLTTRFDVASVRWKVDATWNRPAAGAVAASSWVIVPSGACAYPWTVTTTEPKDSLSNLTGSSGTCRVSVKARNAVGTSSASATATALLP